ncbi:MAG: ribose 5-phosphate isomerase B [Pseudodesulfovibrio sp.]|uniref:Sugar-phosphate isomerase, RpiB/LacA/LacB family n=1 Tax=Pseudodesulfovibrio aespoeensis (strain ATCC 700646 / DSM 10631 / Aspo-2) TaxID=643562 RepID=E6VR45_PSEA9|nr:MULTISPECIES: ribose 5-phosphate isomerase B [Pseudodesulfovibrio]MBU4192169.1 ribose 5-phosphate isomerase B [Pseudomonadota bacterium]MCG2732272.1 ribose 5-phosphate isomerase B [Pseudodesulfovibrio aespoeensis]ADU64129.1 sugar-phosphate isomerase, RpiB/LacA/LacB family [Pseudodesulfovibrio aespoeensis Aspo-2]MBU4245144.1 ribose 5-phosphate isomerase B [Pseudomonadota bacterium]MBU4379057.1 ribose 5-phosphate isomerase B [Pseudomonadota bacterium]
MSRTIVIGSDHGGYTLKQALIKALADWGCLVEDQGPDCLDSCDYPIYAAKVVERVRNDNGVLGVLICGTGQGMTMTANRMGVRAALCTNEFLARMAREHNDARILCLGERVTGQGLALAILKTFLETGFGGERHQRRIDLMDTVSK